MTTPTGDITLGNVATELGIALPLTLGDARVLTLRGGGTVPVTLGELRGKSRIPVVTLDTTTVYGSGASDGAHPLRVTTETVTASVTGGVGPYVLAWERVSGTAFTITASAALATAFQYLAPTIPGSWSAVYRLKATGSDGQFGYSPNVTASIDAQEL